MLTIYYTHHSTSRSTVYSLHYAGACPGGGSEGFGVDPPLLQLMVAFIHNYALNNIDVVKSFFLKKIVVF